MELQHLRTFVAVADAGSLTRAAESLHLSQPAVSAQIRALEASLDLPLFHRAARGMRLTDAGREFLAAAGRMLQQAEGLAHLAQRLRGDGPRTLRLGTIDCGYDIKLARIIGMTAQRYPQLEVHLQAGNSGQHIHALLDHDLDITFAEGTFADPRFTSRRLGTSRLGIIGPSAWRDRVIGANWNQLAELPWIFQSRTCSHCVLLDGLIKKHRLELKPQIQAEAFGEVKELVAEGLGLSISDLDDAAPLVEAGRLVVWPGYASAMPLSVFALTARADEPAIATLMETAASVHRAPRKRAQPSATA